MGWGRGRMRIRTVARRGKAASRGPGRLRTATEELSSMQDTVLERPGHRLQLLSHMMYEISPMSTCTSAVSDCTRRPPSVTSGLL